MQVFANLLHNAARYTEKGGQIKVVVSCADKKRLQIAVADSGCGIAPEVLPHVFDRFFRGDESRARQSGGSGLGLAIAKEYTLLHGGEISVESVLGKGTVFKVELPLEEMEI